MKLRFATLLLLAGCTLHPTYERPIVARAEAWRDPPNTLGATEIAWWEQFQDPVLDALIQEALQNNQDIKVAIARVEQFYAQLGIVNSRFYPQLQGGGLAEKEKVSPVTTFIPPGTSPIGNAFDLTLNASYFVDLWGEVRSASESAYHAYLASIEGRRTTVLAIVSTLASTYIQMRQYDVQIAISQKTLQDREEAYFQAKTRYELGLTSELQVEQAISEMESAAVELKRLEILDAEAENLICLLIGKPSQKIERGSLLNEIPMPPSIPACLPSEIVNQRPDILAAEQKLIAANAKIGVAKAKFFPQISLTGSYGFESTALKTLLQNSSSFWDYGATLFQEIFTGGRLTSNLELTRAEKQEALHTYIQTVLQAFKEVNDALTSHKIFLELMKVQEERVRALKQYLVLSNLRYQEGETDYLTFLDAERELFQGLLDYEETKGNTFKSLIQVYQALGGSWVLDADQTSLEKQKQP